MKGLLFTYALTYGGAVVALFNPFYGLLIYICFAIVKPPALWYWSVAPGNYSRIIGVALLIGWALNGFGDGKLGKAKPIVISLLGYTLWMLLSTIFSPPPELGWPSVENMVKIVLPFVAGVTLVRTRQQLQLLLFVILASCAFITYEINLAYLRGGDIRNNGFMLSDNNSISIWTDTSYGLALVLGLEEVVAWRSFMYFGVAAAMAHVPMLAMSRGGMLGTLAATIVAVLVVPKTRRSWIMIAGAAVVGSILAGPSVVERFSTSFNEREERDSSAQSRLDLWRDCTDAMLKNPLFGIGQERWKIVAHEDYGWPQNKEAHSNWFQTGAELGIPGVTFLLLFYVLTIVITWRGGRQIDVPWMPTMSRMILVSMVGFCVSVSFVTAYGLELPFYVALIGACAVKVAYAEEQDGAWEWVEHDTSDSVFASKQVLATN